MIIRNKKLGISSEDVKSETDLVTLARWRIEQARTLDEIINKLTKAKAIKAELGTYVDRNWFNRTESARRLQEILFFEILLRIKELENLNKND